MEKTKKEKQEMISINDLVNKSFAVYKTIFWKIIKMSLLGILFIAPLVLIITLYSAMEVIFQDNGSTVRSILNIVLALGGILATIFGLVLMYITQVGISVIVIKNDPKLKIKEAFKIAKSKAVDFFSTSLLAGVITILLLLLFIIPGIIFSVYYSFIAWIILKEGLWGMRALKRSKFLIKDYWWAVFGRLALLNVVIWIIFSIPAPFVVEGSLGEIIYNIASQILSLVITPFSLAYSYYMYKSLVKIKGNKEDFKQKIKKEDKK